jgi:SHS2 domain-containing protein
MMVPRSAGYREVEHTADRELEVWGPDMAALLTQAARGMYDVMEVEIADGPRERRRIELGSGDRESLLVEFLGELLYFLESERLAFDDLDLTVGDDGLEAWLEGASVRDQSREIKAVTYHRLEVRETGRGLETRIVFDV